MNLLLFLCLKIENAVESACCSEISIMFFLLVFPCNLESKSLCFASLHYTPINTLNVLLGSIVREALHA